MKNALSEMFDVRDVAEWIQQRGWELRETFIPLPIQQNQIHQHGVGFGPNGQPLQKVMRWFHPDHEPPFSEMGFSLPDAVQTALVWEVQRLVLMHTDDGK